NGNILKFEDNKYYKYSNRQLIKSGTYTLVQHQSFDDDKILNRIIYDGDVNAPKELLEIKKGKLIIYWGGSISLDGAVRQYKKL
ncbi:MAG: hypothetical protein M3142_01365, partial [Bacteroidota bacterium]|nr:hypothetical protein [Bacteroidota bacterium]